MNAPHSPQSSSLVKNILTEWQTGYIVSQAGLEAFLRERYPDCADFRISVSASDRTDVLDVLEIVDLAALLFG